MIKKFISLFLSFALVFSLLGTTAFAAANDLEIEGDTIVCENAPGSEISYHVNLKTNPGFTSGKIIVGWDGTALKLKEVVYSAYPNASSPPIPNGASSYAVSFGNDLNTEDYTTTGPAFEMKFEILSGAVSKKYDLTITADPGDFPGIDIVDPKVKNVVITNGSITLREKLTGELVVAITKPEKGDTPETNITGTNYTGSIDWTPAIAAGGKFAANTEYTANVTLTAKDGYQFAEGVTPSVAGADSVTGGEVKDSGSKLEFKATFPETGAATLKGIKIIDKIDGHALTVDVPHAAPNTTETNTLTLVATSVYDAAPGGPVAATWEITNDPKLTGVSIDKDTGKLTVDNTAAGDDVHVKAEFNGETDRVTVTITKEPAKETHIVATAPAGGTNITIPNGGTNTSSGNCSYKVYDQYGAEMTGSHATWKMKLDPTTATGVHLIDANGSISVTSGATACKAILYAEIGALKSNEITFNIARAASVATSLEINVTPDSVNVPTVTEPGTTSSAYATYTATVKDQYGQEMPGQTIEWSVTDNPGVTINNGQLTVTNKADAGTVTITAKSGSLNANKDVTINKDAEKATFVEICNQVGEAPETRLLIPAATFTNSEAYMAKVYDQYGAYMPGEMVDWELVPATVASVELDTTTSTGNAILKVDSTATSGTTFKLKATTATSGTTGVKELDITVQKKTNVSSDINFNDGSLTYNGNGQKYEKASISGITAGDNPKWTYTYAVKSGGTGALDAAGLPKIVGTYTVTATYEDSSNIGSKSATLTIKPREVAIPAADTTVYTYDGTEKTYNIPTSTYYTVSGNKQTNANEGGYPVTVALTDTANTTWPGGNTGVQIYYFKIMKAPPPANLPTPRSPPAARRWRMQT